MMPEPGQDPEHVRRMVAVGNICVQWAAIEQHVAATIWSMLGLSSRQGKIVTGGLAMLARVNMAIALGREKREPKELIDALVRLRKNLQDGLDDARNLAVHGIGFVHSDGTYAGTELHRGRGGRDRRDVKPADLEDTADQLRLLAAEFLPVTLSHQRRRIQEAQLHSEVLQLGLQEMKRRAARL